MGGVGWFGIHLPLPRSMVVCYTWGWSRWLAMAYCVERRDAEISKRASLSLLAETGTKEGEEMRRISVLLAVLAVMLVGVVPVASATPPESVEIVTASTSFGAGTFTSDIPGCAIGTWTDDFANVKVVGNFDKGILNIKVDKTLICDDGGEFVIRLLPKVRGNPDVQSGPWRIVGGMIGGDEVHGTGSFDYLHVGETHTETFIGKIHIG